NLDSALQTFSLKALMVLSDGGEIIQSSSEPATATEDYRERTLKLLQSKNEAVSDEGAFWIGARRVQTAQGPRIIAAVFPAPERIQALKARISSELEQYRLLSENRKSYRDTYVLMLALMTVLALFAAVWIGLNLSKRITVPIEALSVATREISEGNLDHRVD